MVVVELEAIAAAVIIELGATVGVEIVAADVVVELEAITGVENRGGCCCCRIRSHRETPPFLGSPLKYAAAVVVVVFFVFVYSHSYY